MKLQRLILTALILALPSAGVIASQSSVEEVLPRGWEWVPVAGAGVHRFTTAIVHSQNPTEVGMIQRSTETVELSGDLTGRILYHPVSIFDFQEGTLVNVGHQVFSGTVLGSPPVLLLDDEFRFEVDLTTGVTVGEVYLVERLAGPRMRCRLTVTGSGLTTPEGDAVVDYSGACRVRSEPRN